LEGKGKEDDNRGIEFPLLLGVGDLSKLVGE